MFFRWDVGFLLSNPHEGGEVGGLWIEGEDFQQILDGHKDFIHSHLEVISKGHDHASVLGFTKSLERKVNDLIGQSSSKLEALTATPIVHISGPIFLVSLGLEAISEGMQKSSWGSLALSFVSLSS